MPLDMILNEPHWWWLIVALILGIAEIVVPGFFLIWLAAAAALVGIIAFIAPIPVLAQAVIFALAAIGAVYAGRRYMRDHAIETSDPHLNDRIARLIGETVLVVEPIIGGSGRVKVGDGVWSASGADAPAGAWVRITGAKGSTLAVEPV